MTEEEKSSVPTEEEIWRIVNEWDVITRSIPVMERQIQEMINSGDPCRVCVDTLNMLTSLNNFLKELMEPMIADLKAHQGFMDEQSRTGLGLIASIHSKWHSVTNECILRMAAAAHQQLVSSGAVLPPTCTARNVPTKATMH